jgi:hypothetical protein
MKKRMRDIEEMALNLCQPERTGLLINPADLSFILIK